MVRSMGRMPQICALLTIGPDQRPLAREELGRALVDLRAVLEDPSIDAVYADKARSMLAAAEIELAELEAGDGAGP